MELVESHCPMPVSTGFERRKSPRRQVAAQIVFSCFTSIAPQRFFSGRIRDCTQGGLQIESSCGFKKGTALLIRMLHCPFYRLTPEVNETLRTVLLAEVRWLKSLDDEGSRFVMGVRCL